MSTEHAVAIVGTLDALRTLQQVTGAGTVQVEVVTDSELTLATPAPVSVTGTSGTLLAATTGIRHALVTVLTSADTGIWVSTASPATSSNSQPVEAGGVLKVNSPQALYAIRMGSVNVTAYVLTGAPP